ncbi:hypothetical protein KSP40_PGU021175 [Platanthera guangdongensis]|uniref:Uncharacterized protein n=1 Tax=Platanthera guangdongensis TaxID=2320717 RepID=A0ABR2M145_9ASPA
MANCTKRDDGGSGRDTGCGRKADVRRCGRRCFAAARKARARVARWRRDRSSLDQLVSRAIGSRHRELATKRLSLISSSTDSEDYRDALSVRGSMSSICICKRTLFLIQFFFYGSTLTVLFFNVLGHSRLKELDMSRCSKITDAGIKQLLSIKSLRKLEVFQTGQQDNDVAKVSHIKKMGLLDKGLIRRSDSALNSLYVLTKLEYLDIWGSEISNIGATALEKFPMLNYLNIAWTKVTRLPNLPITSLNISKCGIHSIVYRDDKSIAPLSKLVATGATFFDADEVFSCLQPGCLKFLDISRSNVNSFNFAVNLQGLEHLDLSYCQLTDGLMEQVATIGENLSYLDLSNTKITSHSLSILTGCVQNLENLSLSHSLVDDASLAYISMMPCLRVVDLSCTRIRGFVYSNRENSEKMLSLSELQNLTHLVSLNLEDTKVIDEALQPLSLLTELEYLYLKSDFLTDISLHALSSLQKLRFFGFRGCVITDYGLLSYRTPPLLSVFDLRGSWLLSADAISSFRRKHEQIEVRHEHVNSLFVDENVSYGLPAPLTTTKATLSRLGTEKSSKRPSFTSSFADERIKYSAEELLELKSSPGSRCTREDLDLVPGMLRNQ